MLLGTSIEATLNKALIQSKISLQVNAQFKVASMLLGTEATLNKALIRSQVPLSMEILRCNR